MNLVKNNFIVVYYKTMSRLSQFDTIDAQSVFSNALTYTKSNVNQTTSNTTGVTLTGFAGIITTMPETLATSGTLSFTVTHTEVAPTSLVLANVAGYSGAGIPIVNVASVTRGSFALSVSNAHATTPLNSTLKIGYQIL